ncbi:MAG TPA: serpin family protein [Planctomycetaceae bacterium]|nr:serpin family protein [Planctomycetaceae bacterium]
MIRRPSAAGMLALFFLVAAGAIKSLEAQTPAGSRRVTSDKPAVASITESSNQFTFDFYSRIRADQGNLFCSPASLYTALAMTSAGAAGETATELARTLHVEGSRQQLDEAMRVLLASWKGGDKQQGFRLSVANRLWAQTGEKFLPAYLAVTRTDYGAELAPLDFAHHVDEARQTINKWIEDQTEGKIADLIRSPSQLTGARLVLTNAVYFKGHWAEPFRKDLTKEEDFHLSGGPSVKAPLMHTRHRFRYAAIDGVQILELPYVGDSLSLIALLPEKQDGLPGLEGRLTLGNWQKWMSGLVSQEVIVTLPRFKTTSQFELKPLLESMGIAAAFDPHAADFSGMTGDRTLYMSAVLHKAYVDVNEEGTEAAAATGVVMKTLAVRRRPVPPAVFRADHPFLFVIQDNRNGAILFLGRVADPTRP